MCKNIINKNNTVIYKTIFEWIIPFRAGTSTMSIQLPKEDGLWWRASERCKVERVSSNAIRHIMDVENIVVEIMG